MDSNPRKRALVPGILLLLAAVLVNRWTLAQWFASDRHIAHLGSLLVVGCLQLLLAGLGLWLLRRRTRSSRGMTCSVTLVALLLIGGGARGIQLAARHGWRAPWVDPWVVRHLPAGGSSFAAEGLASAGVDERIDLQEPGSDIAEAVDQPTFHDHISPLLQRRCQVCHHQSGPAPFELLNLDDVRKRSRMIAFVVEGGIMPPWFAAAGSGPWSNDMSLSEPERRNLLTWIDQGCPEGDPAAAPPPLSWPRGWFLGEPDLIVQLPEPIPVPAEGVLDYQYVFCPATTEEDMWVQAIQVLPEQPEVVHHVLVFCRERSGRDELLDILIPGKPPTRYPQGLARFVPRGSSFRFEIHYTPNGRATQDQTRLGLYLAETTPKREIFGRIIQNMDFTVPAGHPDFPVEASFTFPEDVLLRKLMAHMHLRGVSLRVDLTYPDGSAEEALSIPEWDPDWQLFYEFAEPRLLPSGTELRVSGRFDNSAANPINPDPSVDVDWGNQIFDEMMGVYAEWVFP